MTTKGIVYICGIVVLGLGYGLLKDMIGGIEFVVVVIVYLVALRLVAERVGKDRQPKSE